MRYISVSLSKNEYEMLKKYAAARRKYELGKGFTVDKAFAQVVSIGLESIAQTEIFDKNGNIINWNDNNSAVQETVDGQVLLKNIKFVIKKIHPLLFEGGKTSMENKDKIYELELKSDIVSGKLKIQNSNNRVLAKL